MLALGDMTLIFLAYCTRFCHLSAAAYVFIAVALIIWVFVQLVFSGKTNCLRGWRFVRGMLATLRCHTSERGSGHGPHDLHRLSVCEWYTKSERRNHQACPCVGILQHVIFNKFPSPCSGNCSFLSCRHAVPDFSCFENGECRMMGTRRLHDSAVHCTRVPFQGYSRYNNNNYYYYYC